MFKINILSIKYFTMKINIQDELNVNNVEFISKQKLSLLEKQNESYYFYIYKSNLLSKWHDKNFVNNEFYLTRLRKLIKKLNIKLTPTEQEKIREWESEDLTIHRAFKTLQFPFSNATEFKNKKCYFIYKNVKFYNKSGKKLKLVSNSDVYFLSNELVVYDNKSKGYVVIIEYKDIKEVEKLDYGSYVYAGINSGLFRYREKNVFYISLMRMIENFDPTNIILKKQKK